MRRSSYKSSKQIYHSQGQCECQNQNWDFFEINESADKERFDSAIDFRTFLLYAADRDFHPVECKKEKGFKAKFFHGGWRCATCIKQIITDFEPYFSPGKLVRSPRHFPVTIIF